MGDRVSDTLYLPGNIGTHQRLRYLPVAEPDLAAAFGLVFGFDFGLDFGLAFGLDFGAAFRFGFDSDCA